MMNKRILLFIAVLFTALLSCAQKLLYKDASQPVEIRLEDLMHRMTLEDKVAQMCQYVGIEHIRNTQKEMKKGVSLNDGDAYGFYPNLSINGLCKLTEEGKVGSFLHVLSAKEANMLQGLAMKSRLQIPLIIGIDAIHGNALIKGTTVYPTPISQASSFDISLVEKISHQAAEEVCTSGARWTFTPNIDVARDARWGRTGETFGEDPYLVSCMGVATIKGFQGDKSLNKNSVIACAKHLIAGSEPANGTNASPMDVSERTLREVFLPPYKAAVEKANVYTIMAAHNELNGIPCHANKWMMNDIMRDEYGFKGFIVSDWMDVERINTLHKVAPTLKEAYKDAVDAGLDMHMHGPDFMEGVVSLVKEGKLSEKQIDRACYAILKAKFELGLFENPYVDINESKKIIFSDSHKATALEAAEKSIILLKNKSLLPLDVSKYKNVLVTGPNANNLTILGDWTLEQPRKNVVTVLDGIKNLFGDKHVTYYDYGDDVRQNSLEKVEIAASMAKSADLAIVVVGENPLRYQDTKTCGENVDRMGLNLLGSQEALVEKINNTGVPTIVILVGGRPLSVNWISENVPALIQAWEPGSMGGTAIANILSGKVNPSAKLPISIPRHPGQIQIVYNHKPSQYFHKYIDGDYTPLYPFGYGLSYTKFTYGDIQLSKKEISVNDSLIASVVITNSGKREGTEIVQLYVNDEFSSVTRPIKELKDFARVTLKPGESKVVKFNITSDKLAFYDSSMKYIVEPGNFKILIGSSSLDKDLKDAAFEVIK